VTTRPAGFAFLPIKVLPLSAVITIVKILWLFFIVVGITTRAEGAYRVLTKVSTYRSEAISLANEVSKYRVAEGNHDISMAGAMGD
jgi:hypothetical protein